MNAAGLQALQRALAPTVRRLRALVNRATLVRVDDSAQPQRVQVTALAGERLSDVPRLQNYGFSCHPPAGSSALLISIAGSRTHPVAILAEHDSRLRDLEAGEVAIYTDQGDSIVIERGGLIRIKAANRVRIESPLVEIIGALTVTGAITSATSVSDPAGSMQEMRGQYNAHNHGGTGPSVLMT